MKHARLRLAVPGLAILAAASVYAVFAATSPAAVTTAKATKVTTITVTAGKPSELAFKLSKFSAIPVGKVIFKVTNKGLAFHDFEICKVPVTTKTAVKNSCVGTKTKILHNGDSATLTYTFTKGGKYEYLCTVTGHAAAGMKGLLGVATKVAAPVPVAATTTTASAPPPATTTTAATGGGGTVTPPPGTAPNENDAACPPGKTIVTAGGGDADGDEMGTEPNDNDGCV